MKTVPVVFLRKPWYVILNLTSQKIQQWNDKVLKFEKHGAIQKNKVEGLYRPSTLENEFNLSLDITFDYFYKIKNGLVGKLCVKLPDLWFQDPQRKIAVERMVELKRVAFHGRKNVQERSVLQTLVHNPLSPDWQKKGDQDSLMVSFEMAVFVCEWAKFACEDEVTLKQLVEIQNRIEILYSPEPSSISKNNKSKLENGLFNDYSIPTGFANSTWICYERTDSNGRAKEGKWGIASSIIEIGNSGRRGYESIWFDSMYHETAIGSDGTVTYDPEGEYLLASLRRDKSNQSKALPVTPTFFIMKVRNPVNQTAMIGLYIYYSIYYHRYIAKTVVWSKDERSREALNAIGIPSDLLEGEKAFKSIPLYIRQYLFPRTENRLTIPKDGISKLAVLNEKNELLEDVDKISLQGFLSDRFKEILDDKKTKRIVGSYFVFYFAGDSRVIVNELNRDEKGNFSNDYLLRNIKIDELTIDYDDVALKVYANFTHHITGRGHKIKEGEPVEYRGNVVRTRDTFQIMLESHNTKKRGSRVVPKSSNVILLSFATPKKMNKKGVDVVWNEGIISGLRDEDEIPAGFKVVIVPANNFGINYKTSKNIAETEDGSDLTNSIIEYFGKNILESYIDIRKIK